MKLIKHIIGIAMMVSLLVGCTRGGEQFSGSGDVYTVTAILGKTEPTSQAEGYVKGVYDKEFNSMTLDVKWNNLLEAGDELKSFRFCKVQDNNDLKETRTVAYSSKASNGNFTVMLAGYKGLRAEEINDFMSGKWYLSLCTENYPEGIIGGALSLSKQNGAEPTYVEDFLLKGEEESILYVEEGKDKQLDIYVRPYYADNKAYKLESSDPTVFTVTQEGLIHGVAYGTASLIITALDEKGAKMTFQVNVTNPLLVSRIVFDIEEYVAMVGTPFEIKATALPETAENRTLSYSSSDENIATVDQDGIVTAQTEGVVTITVRSTDRAQITVSFELKCIPKVVSLDRTNWKAATSGSRFHNDAQSASKVLDGNNGTHWMNYTNELTSALIIAFDADHAISQIQLDRRTEGGDAMLTALRTANVYIIPAGTSLTFENDGTGVAIPTRTQVGTLDFGDTTNKALTGTVNFDKVNAAGIVIQTTAGNNGWRAGISEVRAYSPEQ
ncbi:MULTISPECIES: Ig-like domain-containing protein [Bacteroides]